eukprot:1137344-Pelagomonas_calceolata.AAC.3
MDVRFEGLTNSHSACSSPRLRTWLEGKCNDSRAVPSAAMKHESLLMQRCRQGNNKRVLRACGARWNIPQLLFLLLVPKKVLAHMHGMIASHSTLNHTALTRRTKLLLSSSSKHKSIQ